MFRKKDNDPVRTGGVAEKPAEATPVSTTRSPLEVRQPMQPELPPRRVDLPIGPSGVAGAPMPNEAARAGAVHRDEAGKRLIVGQGISLSGEITACDRLVVEGSVQVTLNQTRAIEITESGRFTNGKAEVEEAEISGIYEGDLTVRNRLLIRSTGQVKGTVRYGELEIERGGRLSGSVSMLESGGK
ncbi:bactofilin family protein [Benzoatithermus flavus]|uniref:Polymer-forming cytoskeletal protein n=1 Tax=Benzoatithermus flavus TaxID=3108223 RepID=A0ABU8XWD1_9PROT